MSTLECAILGINSRWSNPLSVLQLHFNKRMCGVQTRHLKAKCIWANKNASVASEVIWFISWNTGGLTAPILRIFKDTIYFFLHNVFNAFSCTDVVSFAFKCWRYSFEWAPPHTDASLVIQTLAKFKANRFHCDKFESTKGKPKTCCWCGSSWSLLIWSWHNDLEEAADLRTLETIGAPKFAWQWHQSAHN